MVAQASPEIPRTDATHSLPILETRAVSRRFGGLLAVDQVSITIPKGSISSVIGPNGAGKTTLFNMIAGIYRPSSGAILFNGDVLSSASDAGRATYRRPDQIMDLGIARTFQNIRLFANMTALENVQVGMHCRMKANALGAILRTSAVREEEARSRIRAIELLDYVGIGRHTEATARGMSYGDQRRLEIARALASDPKLLLLDEPTAGMNPQETAAMTRFFDKMRRELDLTVLLIEHDMKVVMGISDHISVLDHGQKIAEGTPAEIRSNEQVIEAYLGRDAEQTAEALAQRQGRTLVVEDDTSEVSNA
jgi:branched-chain amino acid transport system ATP-binding protein